MVIRGIDRGVCIVAFSRVCCLGLLFLSCAHGQERPSSGSSPIGNFGPNQIRAWCRSRPNQEIVIGMITEDNTELTLQQWRPTFETYLSTKMANYGCSTALVPLQLSNYDEKTRTKQIDFIFPNPTAYQEMKNRYGVEAFLSVKRTFGPNRELDRFGGVIVRAAARHISILTVADIKSHPGLTICGVSAKDFSGWYIQWYEMLKNSIDVIGTMTVKFKGGDEQAIRAAILDGTCDLALARTETVEQMIGNREFTAADIFTIGNQGRQLGFPQRLTTDLYPEWPLAYLKHVPRQIGQLLAIPLLNLERSDAQPIAGVYSGFAFPYSYEPVRQMLIALDLEGTGRCDPGMYRNGSNPGLCFDCPAGSVSQLGIGNCSLCSSGTWINGTKNTECAFCPDGLTSDEGSVAESNCTPVTEFPVVLFVGIVAGSLGVLLMGFILWQYLKAVQKGITLEKERADTIIQQIQEAQAFANELRTPFVLMRANDFLDMGILRAQEDLRAGGCLVYLDSLAEATEFLSPHVSIFFSHQWLGWHHPDPDGLQYAMMCGAISDVAEKEMMQPEDLEDLFIWVDYYSIPQKCHTAQKAAVEQLGTLASICSYFIVTAPDTLHTDTNEICNRETYHCRCWCRAEIFSHWARRGCTASENDPINWSSPDGAWSQDVLSTPRKELQNMFYMTDDGLESMVLQREEMPTESNQQYTNEFLQSVNVFAGNLSCCERHHNDGTQPCDRETLMLPMLGLYTEVYDNRNKPAVKDMYELIAANIDSIFPSTFEYIYGEGKTVTKPLFGDLIQAVETVLEAVKEAPSGDMTVQASEEVCCIVSSKDKEDMRVQALGKLQPGTNLSNDVNGHGLMSMERRPLALSEVARNLPTVIRRLSNLHLSESESSSSSYARVGSNLRSASNLSACPERFATLSRAKSFTEGQEPSSPMLSLRISSLSTLSTVAPRLAGKDLSTVESFVRACSNLSVVSEKDGELVNPNVVINIGVDIEPVEAVGPTVVVDVGIEPDVVIEQIELERAASELEPGIEGKSVAEILNEIDQAKKQLQEDAHQAFAERQAALQRQLQARKKRRQKLLEAKQQSDMDHLPEAMESPQDLGNSSDLTPTFNRVPSDLEGVSDSLFEPEASSAFELRQSFDSLFEPEASNVFELPTYHRGDGRGADEVGHDPEASSAQTAPASPLSPRSAPIITGSRKETKSPMSSKAQKRRLGPPALRNSGRGQH